VPIRFERKTGAVAGIPTISLPDIVFLLLIFFMVSWLMFGWIAPAAFPSTTKS
jgi:biopolymer transport protein ExbD